MQTEELAMRYRKYRNALKILMLVLIISAGFGIFYWQVTAAQAREAQAQTALNLAAKDESRYRELLATEAIPAQTYDAYRSKLEDAQAVLTAAQAEVASAQANLLKNDENKALEQAARDQAAALQGQLDAVNVMIGETEIFAPFAGVVTKKILRRRNANFADRAALLVARHRR